MKHGMDGNMQEDVTPLLVTDPRILSRRSGSGTAPHHGSHRRRKRRREKHDKHRPKDNRSRWFSLKSTLQFMNLVARVLVWVTICTLAIATIWYSYELFTKGTNPHLVAWFSAGAFVLLGFPISMFGIVSHLANYNQPHVQVYVVRILWMVPIYSIESWLAMRFHKQAIYIETLRDLYESYVLYSFLQFLIQVLGGEDALTYMLKDKSPTRGVHMWGLQWCVKPWLMGQPVRRENGKQIQWTSPFFVKCKFGVLQYVLLKFVLSIATMVLELQGVYKEGDFTYKGGYLYVCVLTNLSQCWALYCLIFFYYATKNELAPIRPVGKFLSVKALVFFTWWQSVGIAILYHMDMIPHYQVGQDKSWTKEDVAKAIQDYLICIEMFLAAVVHSFVFPHVEYSPQAVEARHRSLNQAPMRYRKRLGRRHNPLYAKDDHSGHGSSASALEMVTIETGSYASWEGDVLAPSSLSLVPSFDSSEGDEEENIRETPVLAPNVQENPIKEESENTTRSNGEEGDDDGDGDETYCSGVNDTENGDVSDHTVIAPARPKHGFVRALLDSAIPHDLADQTVGIVKGDYHIERKSLLQHASTSDQYELFANRPEFKKQSR